MHHQRALQNWNKWLTHHAGKRLLAKEKELLAALLKKHYGKHALLIGVPQQSELLQTSHLTYHTIMTPLHDHANTHYEIESRFNELPIQTGVIDLVLLAHTHEFVDNPQQIFLEACRVVKPAGLIAIFGFNPYSFYRLKKIPAMGQLTTSHQIKRWLELADFALEQKRFAFFRFPFHQSTNRVIRLLNQLINGCLPNMGDLYLLIARAKIAPLTPIRMQW